jgi:hypothetical protein
MKPIGNFDIADPKNGCTGWAIDPDTPSAAVSIAFYANQPAGTAGSVYMGNATANLPRPDVNAATGYPGNHGFNWVIPTHFLNPCQPRVYVYAIDTSGTGVNPLLSGSPKIMPLLVESVSNGATTPIVVTASSRFGGAIDSINWKNLEFINSSDHGRCLQSASQFYDYANSWSPECYNPTEAGSNADGSGSCSHSQINAMSASANVLHTQCNMAFYCAPGSSSPGCASAVNTVATSSHLLEKTVTVGISAAIYNSQNIIQYDVTYTIPSTETHLAKGTFEIIAAYINGGNFTTVRLYDQPSQGLAQVSIPTNFTTTPKPVIISTEDNQWAIGIYSPIVTQNQSTSLGGYDYSGSPNDYIKTGLVKYLDNIIAGNQYTFRFYLIIGTLTDVQTSLIELIAAFPNT